MPQKRAAFYRIPQYPSGLTRKDAVKLGDLRPGEDPHNTLRVLWEFENYLAHGGESDPHSYIFIDPPLPLREIPFPPSKAAKK